MTRLRSRYAPDEQVRRVARLAAEMGISPAGLRLGADGSVIVFDTGAQRAFSEVGADDDAELAKWESENGLARSP